METFLNDYGLVWVGSSTPSVPPSSAATESPRALLEFHHVVTAVAWCQMGVSCVAVPTDARAGFTVCCHPLPVVAV
jgi:hypothetical protein